MDLSRWLRIRATPRPLLVAVPGGRAVRLAAERFTRERGWELAAAPADADLLVVCGIPGAFVGEAVERVWSQLPCPRARADIRTADDVADELDRARARLGDLEQQRADSAGRASPAPIHGVVGAETDHTEHAVHHETQNTHRMSVQGNHFQSSAHQDGGDPGADGGAPGAMSDTEHGPGQHGGIDSRRGQEMAGGQGRHGGHDLAGGQEMRSGHDMAGDQDTAGDHDMHMMHGGEVAGLPMADRAPDRDGLTLDQLHVTLGPVLSDWPVGMVVRLTLQGDVVQSAQAEMVGEAAAVGEAVAAASSWDGAPAAAPLDSLARLLSVCGCSTATRTARRLRDELLAGVVDAAELRTFARRLRRSRTLRWATDGIGRLDDTYGDLAGDATHRWRRWVDAIEGTRPAADTNRGSGDRLRVVLEELPGLLEGQELAAVRVVVASFDPDLDTLVAPHGTAAAR